MTQTQIINLARRFGLAEPDITKGRKKRGPDSGMDWRAYNAANPTETQKDSRGRWTDTPVGRTIGQAISNVMARQGIAHDPDGTLVHISDIRNEMRGRFTSGEMDDELRRLSNAQGSGFLLVPQSNRKILTDEQREGAVRIGNEDRELLSVTAHDLPPADVSSKPDLGRDPKAQTIGLLKDLGADTYDDWDDADLAALRAHAATLIANVDGAQKRRKATAAAAKKPRATKLTGKAEPDYDAMAAEIRALPVVPESRDAARRMLDPLTIPQLKALANKADVPVTSKMRKQEMRDQIEQQLVSWQLDTDAMLHYGDPGRFDRRRAEAGKSNLERLMGGKWEKPTAKSREPGAVRDEIVATQQRLARYPGDWVPLADLREQLAHLDRADVDAALKEMATQPGVHIIPWDNRKALRQRDHDAALRFGGDENHAIRIETPPKTRADEVNELTAQIMRTTDKAELKRLKARRAELAGEVMHGTSAKVTAKPRTRTPRVTASDAEIDAIIANPTSEDRDRLGAIFSGMTIPQLQQVSARHGSGNLLGSNKAEKVNQLVEHLIGFKLNSNTLLRGKWTDHADSTRNAPAGDGGASLRNAEAQLADMKADLVSQYGEDPDGWPEARGDRQVEEYYDQRERVQRMRRQSSTRATPEVITAAYAELASERGEDLVSLVRLRERLSDIPREDLDRVLKEMDRARVIQLEPDPNRKALPQEARDAAIVLGGDPKHFVFFRGGGGKA